MGTPPRRRFSERMGLVPVVVQTEGMSDRLRWGIWNVIDSLMTWDKYEPNRRFRAAKDVAAEVLGMSRMSLPEGAGATIWLHKRFADLLWHEAYEVLEYVVMRAPAFTGNNVEVREAIRRANRMLEAEHSGFRFIGGELTRVMHPAEAAGVEDAMAKAKASGLEGVHEHISQALALFGNRPEPDYRNAIKEAISAVEGAVKLIEGVRSGGLKDALDALAKKADIHAAMRDGLVKLYGFTSDASGIRHPLMEAATVGEEDARFMIVTCSAAVNWIIAKAEKAGLLRGSAGA